MTVPTELEIYKALAIGFGLGFAVSFSSLLWTLRAIRKHDRRYGR